MSPKPVKLSFAMNLQLRDKVVVITGGAGTIGSAAARIFLEEGALVAIADLAGKTDGTAVAELAAEFPGRTALISLDLCDEESIQAAVDGILKRFGSLDVLIHNAASFHFSPVTGWGKPDPLERHFQVGLQGPVRLMRAIWNQHPAALSGSVVIISSIAGHVGEPDAFAYTPIKAAQKGLMLCCAQEMAPHGGWAVCISPGHTWGENHKARADAAGMTRAQYEAAMPNIQSTLYRRFLEPEEIAKWIAVAASPMGKPMSGQDLHVTLGVEPGGFHRTYKTALE